MLVGSIKSLYLRQYSHIIQELTIQYRITESFYYPHYSLVCYVGTARLSWRSQCIQNEE